LLAGRRFKFRTSFRHNRWPAPSLRRPTRTHAPRLERALLLRSRVRAGLARLFLPIGPRSIDE